jgi:BirA family biotin operon repressor/biotin-[acetyl-CoA-carboxylase] ligase
MNRQAENLAAWPAALAKAASATGGMFHEVMILEETDSTQDAARRAGAKAGWIVTASRQTAGRGRRGRRWVDPAGEGVAVTFVVPRGAPERLAIAAAIGTALAMEDVLACGAGIKWPNDVLVRGRKLAGVLIEQADHLARIGVGVNVLQRAWPAELTESAVSLAQLGSAIDRADVLCVLIRRMAEALRIDDERLVREFTARDMLAGCEAVLTPAGATITGRIERVDPMRGLLVSAGGRETWLPAAVTSVVRVASPPPGSTCP